MAVLNVAKFYRVDPDVVEYQWFYLDFRNREEFFLYHNAVEYEVHKKAADTK
jgi:hypothetical protein